MGSGVDSIVHKCALAALGKGPVTAAMLAAMTGMTREMCSRAMTQIVARDHVYLVEHKIQKDDSKRYRVVTVKKIIGKPGITISRGRRIVIATCLKTGRETTFRSIKDAIRGGYTGESIRRALKIGAHYAGHKWREEEAQKD